MCLEVPNYPVRGANNQRCWAMRHTAVLKETCTMQKRNSHNMTELHEASSLRIGKPLLHSGLEKTLPTDCQQTAGIVFCMPVTGRPTPTNHFSARYSSRCEAKLQATSARDSCLSRAPQKAFAGTGHSSEKNEPTKHMPMPRLEGRRSHRNTANQTAGN